MVRTPSLWRIIQNDYVAHMAFLFPIVFWGLYVFFVLSRQGDGSQFFLYAAPLATVIAAAVVIWRYRIFSRVFSDGLEAPGIVSSAAFFRGRGRIECTYTYQGQKLISGNAIHETNRSRDFEQGTEVTLVVDRNNPKRAFIRDLYL